MGFEPTLSGSRNRRISRLSYVLIESTQRELNPHILHGEQAGYRYITGAQWDPRDLMVTRNAPYCPVIVMAFGKGPA